MAPLFSKANLDKFRHDAQNEVTSICAKFCKDLFSISKVIDRKKVAPVFWPTMYKKSSVIFWKERFYKL